MNKIISLTIFIALLTSNIGLSQNSIFHDPSKYFEQFHRDSLYNSRQIISIFRLPLALHNKYTIEVVYDQAVLKKASTFATEANAMVAINAGFFDLKNGGSVTYFEKNDSLISITGGIHPEKPLNDSLINGVVIITKTNKIKIEYKQSDSTYLQSLSEAAVLATGPVLILDGEKVALANKKFVNNRHPRTCLCLTEDDLLLITIDGRSTEAAGMSLFELQDFLSRKKCLNAINLDGGGSTTMWVKCKGIVNYPSDKSGERKVANVLIIKEAHSEN